MAAVRKVHKPPVRKNPNKRKPAESYAVQRERKKKTFLRRKLPRGRTLSTESVTAILEQAQSMGCKALFDLGAGAGLILNQAKDLGFSVVGGIEVNEELSSSNEDIFTTSFADFNEEIAWKNRLKSIEESSAAANPAKTLFYIYEGGLWDPEWCLDAVRVIHQLAEPGDLICVITHNGTISVKDNSWDIGDWLKSIQFCQQLSKMEVYGKEQNAQRDVHIAYFLEMIPLRF